MNITGRRLNISGSELRQMFRDFLCHTEDTRCSTTRNRSQRIEAVSVPCHMQHSLSRQSGKTDQRSIGFADCVNICIIIAYNCCLQIRMYIYICIICFCMFLVMMDIYTRFGYCHHHSTLQMISERSVLQKLNIYLNIQSFTCKESEIIKLILLMGEHPWKSCTNQ